MRTNLSPAFDRGGRLDRDAGARSRRGPARRVPRSRSPRPSMPRTHRRDGVSMPAVREVQAGVWHWEAPHPDWTPEDARPDGWGPVVSSYAIDDGARLLLFDPLDLPS